MKTSAPTLWGAVKAFCDSISSLLDVIPLALEEVVSRLGPRCIISSMAAKVFLFVTLIAITHRVCTAHTAFLNLLHCSKKKTIGPQELCRAYYKCIKR